MLHKFCENTFLFALFHDLYHHSACQLVDMSVAADDFHKAAVLPECLTFFQYLCVLLTTYIIHFNDEL